MTRLAFAFCLVAVHSALVAAAILPRYDALLFAGVAVGFAWLVRDCPGRTRFFAYALFLLLFGGAVFANQLSTGVEGRHALVGGIIPWSDAEGFLSNAWRAQLGLPFSTTVTRTAMRPLYPMTFAFTLAAMSNSVKLTLAAYAIAVALLGAGVVTRIGTRHGHRAAALALVIVAFYMRRYLFVIGTESLGVLSGLAAFGLFMTALEKGDAPKLGAPLVFAFLLFGVALAARPGPMFAVAFMLFWLFRRAERKDRIRLPAACAAAFALALGFNALVIRTTGERTGVTGGEFPPILYGALHGEDYTYLAQTHPEIGHLPQNERIGATARLIGSEIAARPWLVFAYLRGGGEFLVGPHGLFSLGYYNPDDSHFEGKGPIGEKFRRMFERGGIYRFLNLIASALVGAVFVGSILVGAFRALRRKRKTASALPPLETCALVVLAGAALSACATPPWITEGAQLQASTLGFLLTVPWAARTPHVEQVAARDDRSARIRGWLAPALVGAWTLAAFVYCAAKRGESTAGVCENGRLVRLEPSMLVRVRGSGERGYSLERMEENLRFVARHNRELTRPLVKAAAPGVGIEMIYDACAERAAVVVDDAAKLESLGRAWFRMEGTTLDSANRVFGTPTFTAR